MPHPTPTTEQAAAMRDGQADRELIELAAKAAGIELVPYTWDKGAPWGEYQGFTIAGEGPDEWNPLTDDGDALRLVVTLGAKYPAFVVGIFNRASFPHTSASVVHQDGRETYVEQDIDDDIGAATRRAIVRAAAEIGRAAHNGSTT